MPRSQRLLPALPARAAEAVGTCLRRVQGAPCARRPAVEDEQGPRGVVVGSGLLTGVWEETTLPVPRSSLM